MLPSLPADAHAAEFMRAVIAEATEAGSAGVGWSELNRLAARWLWPVLDEASDWAGPSNTSQLGHTLVRQMHEAGLIEAEMADGLGGYPIVLRVAHPRFVALTFGCDRAA